MYYGNMYVLHVCYMYVTCMLHVCYMYVLHVCVTCMCYMYVLHVCVTYIWYMYGTYVVLGSSLIGRGGEGGREGGREGVSVCKLVIRLFG